MGRLEQDLDRITTEMAEHICDKLCHYPRHVESQDELEDICCDCKMGYYINEILNLANRDGGERHEQSNETITKIQ